MSGYDGYRIKSGKVIIYDITETDGVHETTEAEDTKQELLDDITKISIDFIDFMKRISNDEDLSKPSLITPFLNSQNTNYSGFLSNDFDTEPQTRFCTLFYPLIMTDPESFKKQLLGEGELLEDQEWVKYVDYLLNGLSAVSGPSQSIIGLETTTPLIEGVDGFIAEYKKLKEKSEKKIKEFKESQEVKKFETYDPYSKDKKRMFNYVKVVTPEQQQISDFELTYTKVNAGSTNTFNYKVSLN
jgi:hypothetical protein